MRAGEAVRALVFCGGGDRGPGWVGAGYCGPAAWEVVGWGCVAIEAGKRGYTWACVLTYLGMLPCRQCRPSYVGRFGDE